LAEETQLISQPRFTNEFGLAALAGRVAGAIPVAQPRLPAAAEILPYLEAIDTRRWYSNYGPLVSRLEEELSNHLGLRELGVLTTANATLGLSAALMARGAPQGSVCLMSSWTFAATPHAARAAGLKPWFLDVRAENWALDPGDVLSALKRIPEPVGAVIVVSPFGAPLDLPAWEALENRTGVPVVIDAAAGFDTVRPSRIPSVVSLHATKVLGAGEGGFIVTTDSRLRDRLMAVCNFGFRGSRSAQMPALNAKMSEYHAAVAFAGLVLWTATRTKHQRIAAWYRAIVDGIPGIRLQPGYGGGWVTGTTSVVLPPGSANWVAERLLEEGIETRAWWGQGCHVQPAFADCPHDPLPVTEDLGARVLGLPHFADMQREDVFAVCEALTELLGRFEAPELVRAGAIEDSG
jgi:dTDP-4-amino-4,6-dideoxygalactose transaminase